MVPSVVLGDLGDILRLGVRDLLVTGDVAEVADLRRADAVLIDLDAADWPAHAARLLASFPGLTVIACSADRPAMRVLAGGAASGERPLTAGALRATVRGAAIPRALGARRA